MNQAARESAAVATATYGSEGVGPLGLAPSYGLDHTIFTDASDARIPKSGARTCESAVPMRRPQ